MAISLHDFPEAAPYPLPLYIEDLVGDPRLEEFTPTLPIDNYPGLKNGPVVPFGDHEARPQVKLPILVTQLSPDSYSFDFYTTDESLLPRSIGYGKPLRKPLAGLILDPRHKFKPVSGYDTHYDPVELGNFLSRSMVGILKGAVNSARYKTALYPKL